MKMSFYQNFAVLLLNMWSVFNSVSFLRMWTIFTVSGQTGKQSLSKENCVTAVGAG
jgi:hypothetical protein